MSVVAFVAQHAGHIHIVIKGFWKILLPGKTLAFRSVRMATDGNRASSIATAGLT